MKLIIVHYHLRPGGIRRVIELATPHLRQVVGVDSITLACGEAGDRRWNEAFLVAARPTPVEFFVEPVLQLCLRTTLVPGATARTVGAPWVACSRSAAESCVVWAHNLGIARNLC